MTIENDTSTQGEGSAASAADDEAALWAEMAAEDAKANPTEKKAPSDQDRSDSWGDGTETDASADKPSTTTEAGDKPAKDATPDLWANAPPELKAAYDAERQRRETLEHADRSNRGRLSAADKKIKELEARPPASSDKDERRERAEPDDFAKAAEEYPEVLGPVAARLKAVDEELARSRADRESASNAKREAETLRQEEELTRLHPNWLPTLQQNWDAFQGWLGEQPQHLQDAFARNQDAIVDHREAADVFSRFNATLPNAAPANPSPSSLSGKRQRQLEASTDTRHRGPQAAAGIPADGDPEEIWKAIALDEERKAARATR